ncbi:MAG TPA: putative sugar O-methyltransferase [Reyranella sp.]
MHALHDNYNLTPVQHTRSVGLIARVQSLYDQAPAYAASKGLDPALVLPGNEWATYVPAQGLKFRSNYSEINYLRLNAPFIGYYLPILDRLDRRRYPDDGGEQFVMQLDKDGIPDDIADILPRRMNMLERLLPHAPEYQTIVRRVPANYVVRTPRIMGEIGLEIGGVIANPDVIICQSRINGLLSSGVIDKVHADIRERGRARVLEIGPGYGALAAALKGIFKDKLEYILVDLPSSLYHSTLYLTALADGEGCHLLEPGSAVPDRFDYLFVSNYLLEEFAATLGPLDLAINTMSFPEMSAEQVRFYVEYLRRLLRPDGLVFDENGVYLAHHTDSDAILGSAFPYRKRVSSVLGISRDCQNVWSSRYIREVFDCQDVMLGRVQYLRGPSAGVAGCEDEHQAS